MGLHGFFKSLHGFQGLKVYKKSLLQVLRVKFTAVYVMVCSLNWKCITFGARVKHKMKETFYFNFTLIDTYSAQNKRLSRGFQQTRAKLDFGHWFSLAA
jgi:hypothetical protein